MLSIQIIAGILLVFRIISAVFISLVIRRQYGLLKLPLGEYNTPRVRTVRKVLFILSIVVFFGNFIPIVIDAVTLFNQDLGRPQAIRTISIAYALSNATTAMVSAILIWLLYWIAGKPDLPRK